MAMMSETNGITSAHRDLKSMQMKLQSSIEELRHESVAIRTQTETAQNEMTRLINAMSLNNRNGLGQLRYSIPGSSTTMG